LAEGEVKWFDEKKGYGFIEIEDGPDIFVHHSGIEMPGLKTLADGDRVSFNVEKGDRGLIAKNVIKL
jgi:CspA family cold shock protein